MRSGLAANFFKTGPTQPVTLAMNGGWGKGASAVVDQLRGGHNEGRDMAKNIDAFHAQFPKQPTTGTEPGSDFSTRGIYKNDPEKRILQMAVHQIALWRDGHPWAPGSRERFMYKRIL